MNILQFVQQRNNIREIHESFNFKDMEKVLKLIDGYLRKHVENLILFPYQDSYEESGKALSGARWINLKTLAQVRIGWSSDESGVSNAYCVDFFKDSSEFFAGEGKTDLTVFTNGASVALILPLIVEIMKTGKYDANSALVKKLAQATTVKESRYRIGNVQYRFIREDESETRSRLEKLRTSKASMAGKKRRSGDQAGAARYDAQVREITAALNGQADMTETLLKFQGGVATKTSVPADVQKADNDLEKQKSEAQDPETAFKMMNEYLKLAVLGDRAGVILCGAPGVGKTFRVKKFLKSLRKPNGAPYTFADDGVDGDIHILKGKGTARELYKYLYRTKERGKILMIDDADSILNDTEGCVNILKAAMEADERDEKTGKISDKGRLVSYAVSGKIIDQNPENEDEQIEIPKKIMYKGKIIIITNWPAGKLDTALRSRAYLQDINFSTADTLKIIRRVKIEKVGAEPLKPLLVLQSDYPINEEGEKKAMDYLDSLAEDGADIELSFRTFDLCAGIFSVITGSDEKEKLAKEMIKENMRLQFARGGKKY